MEKKEYIERGAALLAITGQPSKLHYPEWYKGNIMEVPAADVVEVVHGEWLYVDGKGRHAEYECSVCHDHVLFDEKIDGTIPRYKGCPHCLAKMDGGNRDADA